MKEKSKIAIIHDAFLYRGGGERLVTLMAKALDADLVSGFFSDGSFDPRALGFEGKTIALGKPVFVKWLRHIVLKWRFFWNARILSEYDTVIFSGDCLGASRHVHTNAKKIYYCHTPPRYLYDFRTRYLATLPFFLRPIFVIAFTFFARIYEKNLAQFDHIITNSKTVQKRLFDFTGYESEVIYPPTDMSRFAPSSHPAIQPSNYFLSFARLSPPKRVDLIIEAFVQMPEKFLIFTYGKNDPMKDEIIAKIRNYKNITAIESPDDEKLISLIQHAMATIYIPVDEDFGMSPVESMACGTPVIGSAEWWLLETIIDGKTWKLIKIWDREAWILNLKKVIEATTKDEWQAMKNESIIRAREFSLEKFVERLQSII